MSNKKVWIPIVDRPVEEVRKPLPVHTMVDLMTKFSGRRDDSRTYRAVNHVRRCVSCNRLFGGQNELCVKCRRSGVVSPVVGQILWNGSLEDVRRLKEWKEEFIPCPFCKFMMTRNSYDRAMRNNFDNFCGKCRLHVNRKTGEVHSDVWY